LSDNLHSQELYILHTQFFIETKQKTLAGEPISWGTTVKLKKDVSALEIVRREPTAEHFGVLAQIAKGSEIEICGKGFNERTYRVRFQGRLFFVFRQDLGFDSPYAV
jgi:hypothetical protein